MQPNARTRNSQRSRVWAAIRKQTHQHTLRVSTIERETFKTFVEIRLSSGGRFSVSVAFAERFSLGQTSNRLNLAERNAEQEIREWG